MSTPAEKANLARIRDNQRRSRARRKEYLHELEQRLRLCELQGIEASAEIQVAARKVADENKMLRTLLNKHGINDDSIEAFLRAGIVAPPGDASASSQFRHAVPGNSVQSLEHLLGPRRPACIEPDNPYSLAHAGIPAGVGMGTGSSLGAMQHMDRSRETSVTSISTLWDAPTGQHSHTMSGNLSSQTGRMSVEMALAQSPSAYNSGQLLQPKGVLPNQSYRSTTAGSHYLSAAAGSSGTSTTESSPMAASILSSMAADSQQGRACLGGEVDDMFDDPADRQWMETVRRP